MGCLASEDVVLGYECVCVFNVVSVVNCSFDYYGSKCFVAAVVCLACEDVVLGYGCVGVFIVVSFVKRSLRVLRQKFLCSSSSMTCM